MLGVPRHAVHVAVGAQGAAQPFVLACKRHVVHELCHRLRPSPKAAELKCQRGQRGETQEAVRRQQDRLVSTHCWAAFYNTF